MKTLRITLIVSFLFFASSPIWGQKNFRFDDYGDPPFKPEYFGVGLRVGGGASTLRGLDGVTVPGLYRDILPYKTGLVGTMHINLYGQIMFYNQLLVQMDLAFSHFGAALKDVEDRRLIRGYGYHAKLLFGSKLGIARMEGMNFIFGAGPFVGFGSGGGDGKLFDFEYNDEEGMKLSNFDIKTFQAGLSAMVGLEYNGYSITLGYDRGFTNLAKEGAMRTTGYRLEFGYIYIF